MWAIKIVWIGMQRDQEHTLGDGDAFEKAKAKEKAGGFVGPWLCPGLQVLPPFPLR